MCGEIATFPIEAGGSFTGLAGGGCHEVFLQSDGMVVAFGENLAGECDLPEVEAGMSYTDVATGVLHTVLLRSDGS